MSNLTRPGTDPAIHDCGWRTPVGFIQHAQYGSRPGTYVEAVEVLTWNQEAYERMRSDVSAWSDEPEPYVRLVIGPRDGKGWAQGYTDLTPDEAEELAHQLNAWAAVARKAGK